MELSSKAMPSQATVWKDMIVTAEDDNLLLAMLWRASQPE
jgi:hypothetical protein